MEIFTICLNSFFYEIMLLSLVAMAWQLSIDLKNDFYSQAFVDILTKLHRNVT